MRADGTMGVRDPATNLPTVFGIVNHPLRASLAAHSRHGEAFSLSGEDANIAFELWLVNRFRRSYRTSGLLAVLDIMRPVLQELRDKLVDRGVFASKLALGRLSRRLAALWSRNESSVVGRLLTDPDYLPGLEQAWQQYLDAIPLRSVLPATAAFTAANSPRGGASCARRVPESKESWTSPGRPKRNWNELEEAHRLPLFPGRVELGHLRLFDAAAMEQLGVTMFLWLLNGRAPGATPADQPKEGRSICGPCFINWFNDQYAAWQAAQQATQDEKAAAQAAKQAAQEEKAAVKAAEQTEKEAAKQAVAQAAPEETANKMATGVITSAYEWAAMKRTKADADEAKLDEAREALHCASAELTWAQAQASSVEHWILLGSLHQRVDKANEDLQACDA
ncbi:hypothetical protein A1Q1_04964 [Trichosporon asahii var. asahii CBS 2479]|uniref:Uncharacterized protein n=1 Tax=Trichosporon asahii var. asahii (strain ATCC 90039 / CBS 2479 / JCM 2466 / KCTC 7840 / NBRC 103889/ NCYC 2677 / UAMH 7654) TaxID=1186058 RepID=J4U7W6_TRIAS|nr:hypothetical protein A1Q1_04964 [Trichosporon asahii var. asahii CBS 2479]EJT46475.1 hypothetical protein A1Q1_04964 [Trichosporon asahii var. asahii CBS 2479]